MLNELVSNSIEHSARRDGILEIWVGLIRKDHVLHLSYSDSGKDIPNIVPANFGNSFGPAHSKLYDKAHQLKDQANGMQPSIDQKREGLSAKKQVQTFKGDFLKESLKQVSDEVWKHG